MLQRMKAIKILVVDNPQRWSTMPGNLFRKPGFESLRLLLCALTLYIPILAASLFGGPSVHATEKGARHGIATAFNPETATWNIGWDGRISQYDLVYLSPPLDPTQGIPLGNGDVGVLFWCEGSKIIAAVNKNDLWDDAGFGRFNNWKREEEDFSTTQRHACRIIFDFKFPVFDIMYLSDFKARLSLGDASMSMQAKSPFGAVRFSAFVDSETGILFTDIGWDLDDGIPLTATIERFGSRTFSHWYSLINRDAGIGLSGTASFADDSGIAITQTLSGGTFAAGGTVIDGGGREVSSARDHSRSASLTLSGTGQRDPRMAFAVTSPSGDDPRLQLDTQRAVVHAKGIEAFRNNHCAAWKEFWLRSFMDYGDDYLNNLWHLTMYYARASQGGKYPGRFNNGLWGWSRDVQNWNFYFHWNQQQLYWYLNAAGHHDLIAPYLEMRFSGLPYAKKDAVGLFGKNGAFVSDVTDRRGYNSLSELENHTPVAEIALDFWRQYRYTCDEEFLKTRALPYILEAARFFESCFEKENDGLYHAVEGTGYEGWIKLRDGLTELVYARRLFAAALEALKAADADVPEAGRWRDILDNCAPLPVTAAGDESISREGTGYRYARGLFKGKSAPGNEIFAAGWGIKEKKMLTARFPSDNESLGGQSIYDGIFPTVPSSPVYPSGLIGLKDKGSKIFDITEATTILYTPEAAGWDPVPIVMARLGLAGELDSVLARFPARWQIYRNGWGHWGPGAEMKKDAENYFRTNTVQDAASGGGDSKKFPFPMWPFRHMSMESMSVLAAAMNEALLQSYDGIVRIAPAFCAGKPGRFTLHAEGGFVVSSEVNKGNILWICVESRNGGRLNLNNPWASAVTHSGKSGIVSLPAGEIITIGTSPGEIIMLMPNRGVKTEWTLIRETPVLNDTVKTHSSGETGLGLPRMY